MLKQVAIAVREKSPLFMHKYNGEQPSQEKPPRGKKTQDWIDAHRKKDWLQNAYWDSEHKTFHIPPENIEASLATAAKAHRKGNDFKMAVAVVEDFIPLYVYDSMEAKKGALLTGKLEDFYVPKFMDLRGVRIGAARVDRCRPRFNFWGLEFGVTYDADLLKEEEIRQAAQTMIIGDFRPRFGRVRLTEFLPV